MTHEELSPRSLVSSELPILVSLMGGPKHGYAIYQEANKMLGMGKKAFSIATIYETLHKFVEAGLVEENAPIVHRGRMRVIYALLPQHIDELNQSFGIIMDVLGSVRNKQASP